MNFSETPEFKKDIKRLAKKWRSIPDDIEAARQYILPLYIEMSPDVMVEEYRQGFFASKKAAVLHSNEGTEIIKMRLDVTALAGNTKVRIVFVAIKTEGMIKFIELYAKNEKDREDIKRIKKYLS